MDARMIERKIHHAVNDLTKSILNDGISRKHAIVAYHNFQATCNKFLGKGVSEFDFLNADGLQFENRFVSNEHYYLNSLYGIAPTLRSYANYQRKICACVEHGVYFGDFFNPSEAIDSGLPAVITMGPSRKRILERQCDIDVYPIGPYISYAQSCCPKPYLDALKSKLGCTLLVFPTHSANGITCEYEVSAFANYIDELCERYSINSVIVNMYYKDLNRGMGSAYSKRGYYLSCAGHQMDPQFLPRLKTLISLSKYSTSNSIGTHVGYCISMGVPHSIFRQKVAYLSECAEDRRDINDSPNAAKQIEQLNHAFRTMGPISPEQTRLCSEAWGLGQELSPTALYSLFDDLDNKYRNLHRKRRLLF